MKKLLFIFLLSTLHSVAQHQIQLKAVVNHEKKTLAISQTLVYNNTTQDTLHEVVLNDWMNAYSNKNSPLGKRFSDEFVRSFHIASDKDRGGTLALSIQNSKNTNLPWHRPEDFPDLVEVPLVEPLLPGQQATFFLEYTVKVPNECFTNYGFNDQGEMTLKDWFLTPALYSNRAFVKYNNLNIDDAPNALFDIDLDITTAQDYQVVCDLPLLSSQSNKNHFKGTHLTSLSLYIDKHPTFQAYKNNQVEVVTNFEDTRIDEITKALLIDKITNYVGKHLGTYPNAKMVVSQTDYEQNPFYGLNQLPSFLRPFPNYFIYELKFLKTYLNNFEKNSLQLDSRKDNWIFDAIQVYSMMQYIDEYYPEAKMMGSIGKLRLLKRFRLINLDFNEQYSYFYMLMARKNLDQPLGVSKDKLLKFNEKIASKYQAGLTFRYLADYVGEEVLQKSIQDFVRDAQQHFTTAADFEKILKKNTSKKLDWFFTTMLHSRQIIDFTFKKVTKTEDTVSFNLKSKSNVVPIPIYGLKKNEVVFKEWIVDYKSDSLYTFKRLGADKIVINYKNTVPEYNLRNNWKSLKAFPVFNRPFKFNLVKDLEDPGYNQVLYVPTLEYNYYDGFIAGMRFHNKTILDKPFGFDITPSYSLKTASLSGRASGVYNQYLREGKLYYIRYGLGGENYHYAPDAYYKKLNPNITFRFRENDFRKNINKSLVFRNVMVNREPSAFVLSSADENYSVFNMRFSNIQTEITKHRGMINDVQISSKFGKIATTLSFRRLFNDNRQVNLRLYGGVFLYNKTESNFFSFALDHPTDYLFDYDYFGRSESSGLFSQQYIQAEGAFKSKLSTPYANQWMTALNGSFNIWNWIEVYGDAGLLKNKYAQPLFVYDSGVRLNLVTDYFELYFPVYSNNGLEVTQPQYAEKIRFIVAFSPQALLGLFTRKWF
ncbi:gluzincin family metallopeptidase [Flavobacterium aciduliphilum]|uniref:Peptidase M1 membrane alanine aminopeptidase domain-containing protein n=1 Tax=Flavobacterium aciduliphilum TaxID=1101402 RepID=A0A328YT36_9FLAO|nr:aminopeptidase [Flavobacterium aciduliphilum]RAR75342.1 hypothetical protein CLV55_10137 [Flavobacterium aciduliphilum]